MNAIFRFLIIATLAALYPSTQLFAQVNPVRIAIAGMTHGHVGWILNREDIGDIEVVGLAESNKDQGDFLYKAFGNHYTARKKLLQLFYNSHKISVSPVL